MEHSKKNQNVKANSNNKVESVEEKRIEELSKMNDSWKNAMSNQIAAWEEAKHQPTQVLQLKELDSVWTKAFEEALKDPNNQAALDKIWDESVALENQRVKLKKIDDKNSEDLQKIREELKEFSKDLKKLDQLKKTIESKKDMEEKIPYPRPRVPFKL